MAIFDLLQPPLRSWKEITRELAGQTDPNKILELSEELNRALAEKKRSDGCRMRLP
jgi:hypothetical protein